MLYTHDFPVLERDSDTSDLIGDGEAKSVAPDLFPSRAVFAFVGEVVGQYAADLGLEVIDTIELIGGLYPIYRAHDDKGDFAIMMMPLGAPAAVMCTDFLFRHGVRKAIAVGSCGALDQMDEGELVVPAKALRDEGTSYHYLPASRWIHLNPTMRGHIEDAVRAAHLSVNTASVWTNDAFYRETPAMIAHRKSEGCAIVDMECSAMAASAQLRGADFAQLFYTADSLSDLDNHEVRDWGRDARGKALSVALDAISRVTA